jgi:hypothetical protein
MATAQLSLSCHKPVIPTIPAHHHEHQSNTYGDCKWAVQWAGRVRLDLTRASYESIISPSHPPPNPSAMSLSGGGELLGFQSSLPRRGAPRAPRAGGSRHPRSTLRLHRPYPGPHPRCLQRRVDAGLVRVWGFGSPRCAVQTRRGSR